MSLRSRCAQVALISAVVVGTLIGGGLSRAEIIANLGSLNFGASEVVSCNTSPTCTTTIGTAGGALPTNTAGADPFTHQIVFGVNASSGIIGSTQILNNTTIDVANLTVQLFELAPGSSTAVGTTATLGALLATAVSNTFATTTNFFLAFPALDPTKLYAIQLLGSGAGVLSDAASYSQQVSISPPSAVPLPAAIFLLAAALAGLIGYSRIRRAVR